jgi:PAS domain S-box-containing protein
MPQSLKDQVKALEKRSRLVNESIIDAVWIVDYQTRRIDYVTPSIKEISGFTPEEWVGGHIEDFMDPDSLEKAVTLIEAEAKEFIQGKKNIRNMELQFFHKNGNTYWAELRATLAKEDKEQLKVVGVIRDITEKKADELQLKSLNEKLAKALADKEKLLQEIKVLEGLLPICSACKRIRDENGKWWPLDLYVKSRTDVEITHTICGDCHSVLYKDI